MSSPLTSPTKTLLLIWAFTGVVTLSLFAGCALSPTAAPSNTATSAITLSGRVYGGQQPVYNATIGLYQAGTTGTGSSGYGSGSTNLLTSTVKTGVDGSYSISGDYNASCQTNNGLVYLTATGGDPTANVGSSINNTAIQMVAALGPCGAISSSSKVEINEVTTVAAAFALGQFFGGFGGSDAIGAPSTNVNGLKNAFATAHNLANVSTGVVTPTTAASGTNYSLIAFDQEKLNTIANILSGCVNQTTASSTACTNLFTEVTPLHPPLSTTGTATQPTNVFEAAVYMSLNPTSTNATSSSTNISNLMNLQIPQMPFAPALSSSPTDWTLAIQYTGTGISYLSSAAVDGNGDLWFSNANTTGGAVLLNGGTGTNGGTANVAGGVIGFYSTNGTVTANSTRQVAIDLQGNGWFGGYNTDYLFRTTPSSGTTVAYPVPSSTTLPYAIAVDGNNEVFASSANGDIIRVAATAAANTQASVSSTLISSSSTASLAITAGTTPTAYAPVKAGSNIYEFTTSGTPAATVSGSSDGGSSNYGAAIDGNGKVWIANEATAGSLLTGSGTSFSTVSNGCLLTPQFVAIDGNNNVWVTNGATVTATENSASYTFNTVCEFNNAGTLISSTIGFGPHNISNPGRGIAVDLSGNVWVTSYGSTYNSVTEIVGAAIPVVTPISKALANSTVGTRP